MRNLEECRAEVFRRSEERIRARKRRNGVILAACVPVVLCVALVLAVGLPGAADRAAAENGRSECVTEPAGAAMGASPADCVLYGIPETVETSFPGVEIRIEDFDPADGGTLTVVWENKTEYEVMYGAAYTLKGKNGDIWVACLPRPNTGFEAIGYLLMPGQTRREQYSLGYAYEPLEPGVYRFESTCYVQNTPNESAKCDLSAVFTVEDR